MFGPFGCQRFVFYDDVQLPLGGGKGRGFITRVQIKADEGFRWLSLPVRRSHQGKQLIADAVFAH
ncbi:MAG: WbqC family protein, partial [Saprospiraceae bacterium]|nr:WbqC family protein [Saprospiraceae bacterium]